MRRSGIHFLACTTAMICGLGIDATRSPGVLSELCARAPASVVSAICAHLALLPVTLGLMVLTAGVFAGSSALSFSNRSVRLSVMWRAHLFKDVCCFVLMGIGMFAAPWAGHRAAALPAGAAWTSAAMIAAMLLGMAGGALGSALSASWVQGRFISAAGAGANRVRLSRGAR